MKKQKWIALLLCAALLFGCTACGTQNGAAQEQTDAYFDTAALTEEEKTEAGQRDTQYLAHFGGFVGQRVSANIDNWLYSAYESNPLMLDSIRQRGKTEIAGNLEFWFGMFAPCLIRSAAGSWDMEKDERLYEKVEQLIADCIACVKAYDTLQYDNDPQAQSWMINPSWLNGVMAWYLKTGSAAALELATYIGEYYIQTAEIDGLSDTMPLEGAAQLYLATGEQRFLELVNKFLMATKWSGGDYYDASESEIEFCQMARHNWENVFEVSALSDLAQILDDETYLDAYRYMYESIVLTDRRSTGANTTAEGAIGSPYMDGSAETCSTVSYIYMMAKLLKETKQSDIADEIEMSFFNACLGAQGTAGRWWTYDTPQEGYRQASIDYLNWQSAEGAPEFSCCSSNCALGLSTLADWATLRDETGIYVNYYGESEFVTAAPSGQLVTLTQQTQYPAEATIRLTLSLAQPEAFDICLRIPVWSQNTTLTCNGKKLDAPAAGSYCTVNRTWKDADVLELTLDLSPHYWAADEGHAGELSVYAGPVLLTLDARYNPDWNGEHITLDLTTLELTTLELTAASDNTYPEAALLVGIKDAQGQPYVLCDFATAGQSGTYYTTWFENTQLQPQPLERGVCAWNQRN